MRMRCNTALFLSIAFALALTGCSEKRAAQDQSSSEKPVSAHEADPHSSNPHAGNPNPANPHASPGQPAEGAVSNVKFTAPEGWVPEKTRE